MSLPDLWPIQRAVDNARRYANHLYNNARRADDYDHAKDAERVASEGESALRKLSEQYSDLRSLKASSERAYDEYVANGRDCCSCHINAPCGYCTRQSDEEGAE
ncbi:hypothetical protein GCM10011408_21350 [Dyella caseinilytica]|nr:hypothetical protein GCM10011408_21350 [Dyella caseinilytica]